MDGTERGGAGRTGVMASVLAKNASEAAVWTADLTALAGVGALAGVAATGMAGGQAVAASVLGAGILAAGLAGGAAARWFRRAHRRALARCGRPARG